MNEPMSDARLAEIRSVIEQAPQLVTDSIADELLDEVNYQRSENKRLRAENRRWDSAIEGHKEATDAG